MLKRGNGLSIEVKPLSTSFPWSLTLFREVSLQRTHQENTGLPCLRHGDCPLFLGTEGKREGVGLVRVLRWRVGILLPLPSCHAHLLRGDGDRSGTLDTEKRV